MSGQLYALKLGGELAQLSIDEQLDLYLNKHDTTTGTALKHWRTHKNVSQEAVWDTY